MNYGYVKGKKLLFWFVPMLFLIIFFLTILSAAPDVEQSAVPKNTFQGLATDINTSNIDLNLILPGGPGKDGIPALSKPDFVSLDESKEDREAVGIFIDIDGDQRFYPYSILVWHEVVNDVVGGQPLAITFCPLCGSAIVFSRRVNGDVLEFGVSGLLFESNLLMYDQTTESLWSQVRGEAVVGSFTGTRLEHIPMQLLTLGEVQEKFPNAIVLSRNTGYLRNYDQTPYGNYDENERMLFPVSVDDNRFPLKEIMYVVPYQNATWFAFPEKTLSSGENLQEQYNGQTFVISRSGGEIFVTKNGKRLPGYFEMWFSFATHHEQDGVIWNFK